MIRNKLIVAHGYKFLYLLYLFLPSQDANCVSTIFEGVEQLKTNPAMKEFTVFFQNFERLKHLLTPRVVGLFFSSKQKSGSRDVIKCDS